MPMPTSPLARLGGFRTELHACFPRRADALFELGDALLCAEAFPRCRHLSLEPAHRRGWGSALCRPRPWPDRRRPAARPAGRLPAGRRPAGLRRRRDHLATLRRRVFARARLLLPSLAAFGRPADHRRLGLSSGSPSSALTGTPGPPRWMPAACTRWRTPTRPPPRRSARCVAGCPPARPVPLFVFDAGYDSAQLTLDLAEERVAVLVRLRSDRCFYADPPPAARSPRAAGRAATGPSSPLPTRPPGRPQPPGWSARTTSTAP